MLSSQTQLAVLPDGTKPVPLGSGVVKSILGEGGVAIVYDVWNEQLGVRRAVKVLKPSHSPDTLDRFHTEMKIMAQLRHPNIVEIHAVGKWQHLPYIEMEKIDGFKLEDIIHKRGALALEACTAVGIIVARALHYTHNSTLTVGEKTYKGILHRDLKPANILIAGNGDVKLTDFGIARPAEISLHTMEGMLVGSLQYIAPEQLDGRPYDARADVYSFGCVLYEMVTGHQVFAETHVARLVPQRLKNHYRSLADFKIKIPRPLRALIHRCLELDPSKRPSSTAEVLRELERIHRKLTSLSPDQTVKLFMRTDDDKRIVRFRKRVWPLFAWSGLAAGGAVALGFGIYLALSRTNSMPENTQSSRPKHIESTETAMAMARPKPPEPAAPLPTDTGDPRARRSSRQNRQVESSSPSVSHAEPPVPSRKSTGAGTKARTTQARQPGEAGPGTREADGGAAVPTPDDPARFDDDGFGFQSEPKEETLLGRLEREYGVGDTLTIMGRLLASGRHEQVLAVHDELSYRDARRPRAVIYKLRALEGTGRLREIGPFLENNPIEDAEYHVVKARHLIRNARFREAAAALERAEALPAAFADKEMLANHIRYYKAECGSGLFYAEPTQDTKDAALQSWYDVKYAYRNDQNHRFFSIANESIREIWATQIP